MNSMQSIIAVVMVAVRRMTKSMATVSSDVNQASGRENRIHKNLLPICFSSGFFSAICATNTNHINYSYIKIKRFFPVLIAKLRERKIEWTNSGRCHILPHWIAVILSDTSNCRKIGEEVILSFYFHFGNWPDRWLFVQIKTVQMHRFISRFILHPNWNTTTVVQPVLSLFISWNLWISAKMLCASHFHIEQDYHRFYWRVTYVKRLRRRIELERI